MNFIILAVEEHAAHAVQADVTPTSGTQVIMPAVTAVVVFSLLLIVLWRTVWPKITQGLEDRERKIREEILAAEQAREQAKAALREYEENLRTAREESSQMIAKARADAKSLAEDLRARNEQDLTDMKSRATKEIESAKHAAIAELHAQAATLATAIASRILRREISIEDQRRLLDESLNELATVARS